MAVIAKIRKHAGLAVTLIGIAIIGFVVQDAFGRRGQRIPPVAVINGETVSYDQFKEQEDQITEQFRRAQGEDMKITEEDMIQIRQMAWQRIVSEHTFADACRRSGIVVSKGEMNDMYYGTFINHYLRPYFTNPQTGLYDRSQVKNIINNFDQLSEEDRNTLVSLEKAIRNDRLREKYLSICGASFYMPAALARREAANQAAVYSARYVSCPYNTVDDSELSVSKADYKKFYTENKYRFRQNKNRGINFVVIDVQPTPADMEELNRQVNELYAEFLVEENVGDFVNAVTSGERFDSIYRNRDEIFPGWDTLFSVNAGGFVAPRSMGKAYQMAKVLDVQMRPDSLHISHIFLTFGANHKDGRSKDATKHLADSLAALLNVNGSLMSQLAASNSDDPSAAQNGGDMGWQKDGYFVGYLNRAILATQAGRATVVEGPNAYHVIYVNDKTQPVKKVLAAVISVPIEPGTATVKERYTLANQLLGQSKGTAAGLDSAAARLNLRVRQAAVTELDYSLPGVPSAREVIRWAYNKDTKEGRVADRVFEMENRYVVAALASVNESDYISLERAMEIPQMEYMVKQDKRYALCAKKMAAYPSLEEMAAALNVAVDSATGISMGAYPMLSNGAYEPAVIGTVCGLSEGSLSKPVKGNAGAYCVTVDQVMAGELNPMQVQMLRSQKEGRLRQNAANVINGAMEKVNKVKDNRGFYF